MLSYNNYSTSAYIVRSSPAQFQGYYWEVASLCWYLGDGGVLPSAQHWYTVGGSILLLCHRCWSNTFHGMYVHSHNIWDLCAEHCMTIWQYALLSMHHCFRQFQLCIEAQYYYSVVSSRRKTSSDTSFTACSYLPLVSFWREKVCILITWRHKVYTCLWTLLLSLYCHFALLWNVIIEVFHRNDQSRDHRFP